MSVSLVPGYRVHHRRPLLFTVGALLLLLCVVVPAVSGLVTGASWYNATSAAAFGVRTRHTSAVFDGGGGERVWVISGYAPLSATYYNDTWSSADGVTWTPGAADAGFLARAGHSSSVFQDRLWIIGGFGLDGDSNPLYFSDIWNSTDGISWELAEPAPPFSYRLDHASAVFDGKLWVIGGFDNSYVAYNDTWSSPDGISWTQEIPAAELFQPRSGQSTAVFNGRLWVIGGTGYDGDWGLAYFNDCWNSTDGVTWELATGSAGFSPRYGHSSLVYDGKIWVIGGTDDASTFNDTWYSSDGITWYQATDGTGFPSRSDHSSESYDGKMWVIGGDSMAASFHDAWYSPLPAALGVAGITPATGVNTSTVDITNLAGTGFIRGATVNLTRPGRANLTATGVTVLSPSKIVCSLPITGAEWGPWNVTVTNPDGEAETLTGGFTVLAPAPTVGSITPEKGYNTALIFISNLAGTNFLPGATVKLVNTTAGSDIPATNVSINTAGTSINCTFDLVGAAAAKRNVTVTNGDGQSGTLAFGFLVEPRFPVVTNMIPNSSYNTGVVNVTIAGTDFVSGALVRLEKTGQPHINATNISVNSETNITCSFDLAATADGSWTLNVINPGNQGNNIFQFVIYAAKSSTGTTSPAAGSGSGWRSGGGSSSSSRSPAAVQNAPPPAAPQPESPAEPGVMTTDLSVTTAGIVAEAATVSSGDSLATVSIPAGVVAMDAAGSPLGSVSITPLAGAEVPADTPGSSFSFAGLAYDLGPDGATFSPAITLSFAVPEGQAGEAYSIRMLDEATTSWMDIPTTYDAAAGTVTAQVSHFCCFALFARAEVQPAGATAADQPTVTAKPAPTPPRTAMSIFSGLMLWTGSQAVKYPFLAAAGILLLLAVLWFGRRQYRIYRITRPRKKS
jgi:hypothetical protein